MAPSPLGLVVRHVRELASAPDLGGPPDAELLRRFLAASEHDAFAALVQRHGRMVWGVCRHVLRHDQDAEDAFQATFLVLARRAGSIRQGEAVAGWLYGVACRVARKAKAAAAKRVAREHRVAVPEGAVGEDPAWRELLAALDDEVCRLPEKYRAPFVLCCLQGRSRRDAEAELGWNGGTVSSRIAEARRLLEGRLARRGVALSAALALWTQTASAAVPAAALATATGQGAAVSAAALALVQGAAGGSLRALAALLVAVAMVTVTVVSLRPPAAPAVAPAAAPAPSVDLNGDPLPPDAIARLGTTRFRHGDSVRSMAFTPDGKRLVSQAYGGISIWDPATGREVANLPGLVLGAILSKDGATVLTAERSPTDETLIRVRVRADFKILREFNAGRLDSPRFSADRKLLAGIHQRHSKSYYAVIFDVMSGKQLHSWEAHQGTIWHHDFTPDGKTLVTGGEGGIRFWDVKTAARREFTGPTGIIRQFTFSPDGAILATHGMTERLGSGEVKFFTNDPLIRLWDVASGKETLKLESTEPAKPPFPDSRGFSALRFTPDGKSLVTTGPNSLVRFWDVKTGKEQRRFDAGVNGWALAFSPNGKTLAVASTEIRLFDVATGADASKVAGNVTIHYAYLTPDGRTVATLGGGRVTFWDAATGRMLGPAERSDETIIGLQILDGGRTLIGLSRDKALRVWDVKTRKETRRVRLPFAPSNQGHFALSPDGKIAAIQEEKRDALKLIDLASGREVGRLGEEKGGWYGLAFAPNGKSLIAWHADHFAQVWDVKTGKKVRQFEFLDHLPAGARLAGEGRRGLSYSAELSPDGRLLAYGSQRGYLALHDVTTGKCVRVVNGLPKGARAFGFSPDGRMLAWAGWFAPTIHLLEVATGAERYRLEGHKGDVWSLRFSRDGGTLVSTGADCTGLVWSVLGGTGKPDLDACWDDLGRAAEPAFRAMRRLAGSPPETVAYLGKRLRPIPTPDPKRLAGWIADLDNDSFDRRAAATKALQALGDAAAAACREALRLDPPLEARRRLEKLLAAVGAEEKDPSPERLRTLRSLELLEHVGSPAAREVLKRLAGGAAESWLTRQAKEGYERTAGR